MLDSLNSLFYGKTRKCIELSTNFPDLLRTYTEKTVSVTLELDLVLIGDILVDIFHHNWGQAMLYACFNFGSRNDLVAMISFNTGMLDKKPKEKTLRVRFTKSEIDKVNNDKRYVNTMVC